MQCTLICDVDQRDALIGMIKVGKQTHVFLFCTSARGAEINQNNVRSWGSLVSPTPFGLQDWLWAQKRLRKENICLRSFNSLIRCRKRLVMWMIMKAGGLGWCLQVGILFWIPLMKRYVINCGIFQEARIAEENFSFTHFLMCLFYNSWKEVLFFFLICFSTWLPTFCCMISSWEIWYQDRRHVLQIFLDLLHLRELLDILISTVLHSS